MPVSAARSHTYAWDALVSGCNKKWLFLAKQIKNDLLTTIKYTLSIEDHFGIS